MKKAILIVLLTYIFHPLYANETIKVCGHPSYPPFMWELESKNTGVGFALTQILFEELQIEVDISQYGSWKRCQTNLKNGKVDLIVAAYKTELREKFAVFTQNAFAEDPLAVFVKKGRKFRFDKWDDLIGKTGGSIIGGSMGKQFDDFIDKKLKPNFIFVPTYQQNFKKLETERIDYLVTGLYTGLIHAQSLGYNEKVISLKNPVSTGYFYMAFSKKSKFVKYLPKIEKRLQALKANGTIEKIIKKYMQLYIEQKK